MAAVAHTQVTHEQMPCIDLHHCRPCTLSCMFEHSRSSGELQRGESEGATDLSVVLSVADSKLLDTTTSPSQIES